ncbi:MAG: YraN family protein [Spirochaetes bacterium]|jgi:putative endonuclease|nr:YraN family protein [Spirochaetota bacterium]
MDDRHGKGDQGEDRAELFLKEQGFSIITRNYRFGRYAEIDIIAQKDKLLLFVEVRSRYSDSMGGALYSIRPTKLKRIRKCAESYLAFVYPPNNEIECRFDLIAIDCGELSWHKDIMR